MHGETLPEDATMPDAVHGQFDRPVRPLSARLDVLRVLLAQRYPEHHATVADAQAEIERLRAALTLAANRLDVLALDHDYGTTRRNITDDWAKEGRAALGPNVRANRPSGAAQE